MTVKRICQCGVIFYPRLADIKRGWGRSCSKSCAASLTNRKTGNYQRFCVRRDNAQRIQQEGPDWNFDDMDGHFSNEEN